MLTNLDSKVHKNILTDAEIAHIEDTTKRRIMKRVFSKKKLSKEDIADLFEVSVEYVEKIEKELK